LDETWVKQCSKKRNWGERQVILKILSGEVKIENPSRSGELATEAHTGRERAAYVSILESNAITE
jgi:hypothetical protein